MNKLDKLSKCYAKVDADKYPNMGSPEYIEWHDGVYMAWPDIERALRAAEEFHRLERRMGPAPHWKLGDAIAPLFEDK